MDIHNYSPEEKEIINWFKQNRELKRLSFLIAVMLLPFLGIFIESLGISFNGYGPNLIFLIIGLSAFVSFRELYLHNKKHNLFCSLMAKRMGFEVFDVHTSFVEGACYEIVDPPNKTYYSVYLDENGVTIKKTERA